MSGTAKLAIAFVLILGIMGSVIFKQYETIILLNEENDELEMKVEDAELKLSEYKKTYEETALELNKVREEFSDIVTKLERAKDRQDTVFAKPKLVENMINKSYNEFVKGVSCDTGSLQHCSLQQAAQQSNDQ